jgi:hypothetical protein
VIPIPSTTIIGKNQLKYSVKINPYNLAGVSAKAKRNGNASETPSDNLTVRKGHQKWKPICHYLFWMNIVVRL